MAEPVKVIEFDPSKITNFLNAKHEAELECKRLKTETGDLHYIMRNRRDAFDIMRAPGFAKGR